jgi:preprotein translocase subunit SecY
MLFVCLFVYLFIFVCKYLFIYLLICLQSKKNLRRLFTGISPLLTSGLITSFMSSASFLNFEDKKAANMSVNDKKKREKKIQKFFGIVLCFFQASAYVLSGMYGKFEDLGSGNATMIIMQVTR